MYQIVSALAMPSDANGRWVSADVGNMTIAQINSAYRFLYVTLSSTFINGNVVLNYDDIRARVGNDATMTFNQFLTNNTNTRLPESVFPYRLKTNYVRYRDAFCAGYQVSAVAPDAAVDAQLPLGDRPWLYLSKDGVDWDSFGKHIMVSLNGFFHYTAPDAKGCYVQDGMITNRMCHRNKIGLHSFLNVGQLTYLKIKPSMIYKQNPNQVYAERMYIDLGQDISNKTIMLVIGGYLHVLASKLFFPVGKTSICVNFKNYPILERYFESFKTIDMSSLPMDRNPNNPSMVSTSGIVADDNLVALMQLSQSFVVLVDNPYMFSEKRALESSKLPNILRSGQDPIWPLTNGYGKVDEFFSRKEIDKWSIRCANNIRPNYLIQTIDPQQQNAVTNTEATSPPNRNDTAFWWQIGSDLTPV